MKHGYRASVPAGTFIAFQTAFPNACISVTVTSDGGGSYVGYAKAKGTTGFTGEAVYPGVSTGTAGDYSWQAFGY